MPIVIEQALQALQAVVAGVPIGTNLALLQLMWGILNGSFLSSRGAIFPALQDSGFDRLLALAFDMSYVWPPTVLPVAMSYQSMLV